MKIRWLWLWRVFVYMSLPMFGFWTSTWFFMPRYWTIRVNAQQLVGLRQQNQQLLQRNADLQQELTWVAAENNAYSKALFIIDRLSLQNAIAADAKLAGN